MPLVKTTSDVKKFIPVNKSLDFDDVKPFVSDIESREIKPLLGSILYDAIIVANDANEASETWAELIDLCQKAISHLALHGYSTSGQLKINSSGIQISTDEKNKTAFKWQIDDLKEELLYKGWQAIDDVYKHIEKNLVDYSDYWASSEGYSIYSSSYVKNADILSNNVSIVNGSRRLFKALKPFIKDVEQQLVIGIIGASQDEILRALNSDNTGNQNQKTAIEIIQRLICYKAVSKGLNVLSVTFDERGVLTYESVSKGDSSRDRKTADDSKIQKLINYYEAEAKTQENLLLKFLAVNASDFTEYTTMIQSNTPIVYNPSTTDRVINFM